MSLACMELQLEQWLHNKGKLGKLVLSLTWCQMVGFFLMIEFAEKSQNKLTYYV